GHRLNLYRDTNPHEGFAILRRWAERLPGGYFVYTSNVDGHFQRAGFDPERVLEVHGSVNWMQCRHRCGAGIFLADRVAPAGVDVDMETMRAREPLPACLGCGRMARPNVLMFNDSEWEEARSYQQELRLQDWLGQLDGARVVLVECGAGTAVPTVRHF